MTWVTRAPVARAFPGLEQAAAVAHPEDAVTVGACEEVREERCDEEQVHEPCLRQLVTSFPLLEANVLKSFCGRPVELGRPFVVPPSSCKIAACDPGRGAMASGSQIAEGRLGVGEGNLGVVEPTLLEQGTPEDQLGAADLVDVVHAVVEKLERLAGLILGQLDVAGSQMDLRER